MWKEKTYEAISARWRTVEPHCSMHVNCSFKPLYLWHNWEQYCPSYGLPRRCESQLDWLIRMLVDELLLTTYWSARPLIYSYLRAAYPNPALLKTSDDRTPTYHGMYKWRSYLSVWLGYNWHALVFSPSVFDHKSTFPRAMHGCCIRHTSEILPPTNNSVLGLFIDSNASFVIAKSWYVKHEIEKEGRIRAV